jgi:hypothetical protein
MEFEWDEERLRALIETMPRKNSESAAQSRADG